ncbi:MAG: ATP-dependent DNA helicase RecG [Candidatus Gottesmanbacteria bacterium]|nr:ATP-dependent DNA helicase RecG [Candidatus Gottesmanbacteria bacterium]
MDLTLATPVQYVPRVGPARAKLLAKLGIETVHDLLYYIPFRYDDFSIVSPIAKVRPGETVTIGGTVTAFHNAFTKSGKKMQEVKVSDESGTLEVIWFNQPFLVRVLPVGTIVRLAGKIDWYGHKLVMSSPSYEVTGRDPVNVPPAYSAISPIMTGSRPVIQSLHTGRLVPVYSETAGLTSKWLRGRISFVLETVLKHLNDTIPESVQSDHHLVPLARAIQSVHFPDSIVRSETARRRLAFDELFFLQLRAWHERRVWELSKKSHACRIDEKKVTELIASLPFTLTDDQHGSIKEILHDLTRTYPMNRLLEGDVGSGKTVVAMIAMYVAHLNGLQSVLMAPTQILAEQHHKTIKGFLEPFGISVALITGNRSMNQESGIRVKLHPGILVGTHALLSKKIKYQRLGLVVIDEQQRFGVVQRGTLEEMTKRGNTPHLLTMTATPIPRTIARTIMGNLDLSVLATIPGGRKKIKTWVVPNEKRDKSYPWITQQINQTGGQVFVICPLIDESETLFTAKAATTEYIRLKSLFPELQLGLLHGRMKPKEKTEVLDAFRRGDIHMLVATPVVEVGIDIPNATIMVIEAAERFGLSQLHQLRGRVGRGDLQSYCLLFTEQGEERTLTRLKSMETTHSGPVLADIDLQLRGPGELFGTRQHGIPDLHVARWTDTALIAETGKSVKELVASDPSLTAFPLLRDKLGESTIKTITVD